MNTTLQVKYALKAFLGIVLLAFISIILGAAILINPFIIMTIVLCGLMILAAAINPEKMSIFIIMSTCISVSYLFEISFLGFDILSFYKLAILCMVVPAIVLYGVKKQFSFPLVALTLILISSYLFADWPSELKLSGPLQAFIGLCIPFVFLMIRWKYALAKRHILIICLLPLASLLAGSLFHILQIQPIVFTEFTGVIRLQGANIPAHLAMLAFLGFCISLIEIKRSRDHIKLYYLLVIINLLILVSTGTRGPLIACIAIILVYVIDHIKEYVRGRIKLVIPLIGFLTIFLFALYTQWDEFMQRTFGRETTGGLDLSGRTEAWEFFLGGASQSPWFGKGLGASLIANDGSLYSGFIVPHNEYIRFYYDSGMIGALLFFASLIFIFVHLFRRIEPRIRAYYSAFIIGFLVYTFSDNTLSTIQFIIPFCWYLGALHTLSKQKQT